MFCFDPATDKIKPTGRPHRGLRREGRRRRSPRARATSTSSSQGGKLYFATHIGYYSIIDGMEKMGIPPAGWKPYPGRPLPLLRHDDRQVRGLGHGPARRGHPHHDHGHQARPALSASPGPPATSSATTWRRRSLKDFGPVSGEGENGKGANYRTICRSIAVDPADGSRLLHHRRRRHPPLPLRPRRHRDRRGRRHEEGLLRPLRPDLARAHGLQLAADLLVRAGEGDLRRPRQLRLPVPLRPAACRTSKCSTASPREPSQRSGMFDQFSYGYLGFTLGPDGRTLYYLTGGPIYVDGKRARRQGQDRHGRSQGPRRPAPGHLRHSRPASTPTTAPIFFENGQRPLYVNSIAVARTAPCTRCRASRRTARRAPTCFRVPRPVHEVACLVARASRPRTAGRRPATHKGKMPSPCCDEGRRLRRMGFRPCGWFGIGNKDSSKRAWRCVGEQDRPVSHERMLSRSSQL